MLSLPWAQVQSLVRELRSHRPHDVPLKGDKKTLKKWNLSYYIKAFKFSHVQLFGTPWTAHQAPLSMGVSRWEYWSGLPWSPPRDLPNPGTEPRSPILQVDSLPSEPTVKPKNTGMGSLSLLHVNFLTQELNLGLLHCRWILYHLSYEGSP